MNYNFRRANSNLSSPLIKSETRKSSAAKVKETFSHLRENSQNNTIISTKKAQNDNALQHHNKIKSSPGKDVKMSQNLILRSRYCQEEIRSPEYSKKSSRPLTQTRRESSSKNAVQCDVNFLRSLLAMNKKEEFMINKKLSRLLAKEEFGSCTQLQKFGRSSERSRLAHSSEDDLNSVSSVNIESNRKNSPFIKYEYDLNGRRIFTFTDDEDEKDIVNSDYDERKCRIEPNSLRSKTWINTTTVIKTNSDCDLNGRENTTSMTFINFPSEKNKYLEEEYKDELQPLKTRWLEKEVESQESPTDCWSKRKVDSHGDGVQNVVVHCCEVAQHQICEDSKTSVVKVWHFNNVKTEHSATGNGTRLDEMSSPVMKVKTTTSNASCQGGSSNNHRSKRRRLRSNTIC